MDRIVFNIKLFPPTEKREKKENPARFLHTVIWLKPIEVKKMLLKIPVFKYNVSSTNGKLSVRIKI